MLGSLFFESPKFDYIRGIHFAKLQPPKPGRHFLKHILLVHFPESQHPEFALSRGKFQYIVKPNQILHQIFMNLTTLIQIFPPMKKKLKKIWFSSPLLGPQESFKSFWNGWFLITPSSSPPSFDIPICDFANCWPFKPSRPNPHHQLALWLSDTSYQLILQFVMFVSFLSSASPLKIFRVRNFLLLLFQQEFFPWRASFFTQALPHYFLTATIFQFWRLQPPYQSYPSSLPKVLSRVPRCPALAGSSAAVPWTTSTPSRSSSLITSLTPSLAVKPNWGSQCEFFNQISEYTLDDFQIPKI